MTGRRAGVIKQAFIRNLEVGAWGVCYTKKLTGTTIQIFTVLLFHNLYIHISVRDYAKPNCELLPSLREFIFPSCFPLLHFA